MSSEATNSKPPSIKVEFFSDDPRAQASPRLKGLMRHGTDQLAVACAFCTAAGVDILLDHTTQLKREGSFVVVSISKPTDYLALRKLYNIIPKNLYVHWGALTPFENGNSAPLMHSKVFYARRGDECALWTGSHNLTGCATLGLNLEAAVILEGHASGKPFNDALRHLERCRDEATLYDPNFIPPSRPRGQDILVIHAEAPELPTPPPPAWKVHLCLNTANSDELLADANEVRLLLYPEHSLANGWNNAIPIAAFKGSLTGINRTSKNPDTYGAGTQAEWEAAKFNLVDDTKKLTLVPKRSPDPGVTTQAALNFSSPSSPDDVYFSERPRVVSDFSTGPPSLIQVDHKMLQHFDKKDRRGWNELETKPVTEHRSVIQVPHGEMRERDKTRVLAEFPDGLDLVFRSATPSTSRHRGFHPMLMRAKYVLDGSQTARKP